MQEYPATANSKHHQPEQSREEGGYKGLVLRSRPGICKPVVRAFDQVLVQPSAPEPHARCETRLWLIASKNELDRNRLAQDQGISSP